MRKILLFMLVLSLLPLASAWQNTTFNNSLASEFISFTSPGSTIRYLSVPNGTLVTNGQINLTYPQGTNAPDSLVAYYEMNGATERVNGVYNLTNNQGSMVYNNSNCVTDNCSQIVTNRNVRVPTGIGGALNNSFTINFWVRTTNNTAPPTDEYVLFSPATNTSNRISISDSSRWLWNSWITAGASIQTNRTAPQPNTNYMITATRNITNGNITVYVNGLIENSTVTGNFSGHGGAMLLGTNFNNLSDFANGQMDEVSFWNKTLTPTEINLLYTTQKSYNSIAVGLGTINFKIGEVIVTNFSVSNQSTVNASIVLSSLQGYVNNYTANCVLIGTICRVPFNFSSSVGATWLLYNNMLFNNTGFTENTITYNSSTYETARETFKLNVTYDSTAFSSIFSYFVYNGSFYLATVVGSGSNKLITSSIDTHSVKQNSTHSFYWVLTFDSGGSFSILNSSLSNISVAKTNISNTGTLLSLNFTIYDEETLLPVNSQFRSTYNWYLGEGAQMQNISYDSPRSNEFRFYNIPQQRTLKTDSYVELSNSSGTGIYTSRLYNERIYDFNLDELRNISTEKRLYVLPNTNGTRIIVEVKDSGLRAMDNIYVTIKRFYPGENVYRTVENRKTNNFGQFAVRLVEDSIKYSFEFRDANNTLLETTSDLTVSCRTSVCILPFVIEDDEDEFDDYTDVDDLLYSLNFTTVSNSFIFTWNDISGDVRTKRLEVVRYAANGSTIVCNQTSSDIVNSLTCAVGSSKTSYIASIFLLEDGNERRVDTLAYKVGDYSETFGKEGLLWITILLMTMVSFGSFSPVLGITLYVSGYIILGVTGILFINPAMFVGALVIGVLFIWALRT